MLKLFKEHDEEIIQNFELIFDRASNEKTAKQNCVDYYKSLLEDDVEVDIEEIIDLAESYGFDFDDFSTLLEAE